LTQIQTSVYANTITNSLTAETVSESAIDVPDVHLSDFTPEQQEKVNLMSKIGEELSLTDRGELHLKHDTEFIKNNYELSDNDMIFITNAILNYNIAVTTPMVRASFSGGYIHLTYDEVASIVNLAVSSGPAVIAGAMAAILSVYPGIGTTIGAIVGWLGAGAILQSMSDTMSQGKGIKIGIGSISAE
jgi:hypothetical protein